LCPDLKLVIIGIRKIWPRFNRAAYVARENFTSLTRIVRGLMTSNLTFSPRRHVDFEILDVIVHPNAVSYAPSPFEYSAGYRILVQPYLLIGFHGDLPPRFSAPSTLNKNLKTKFITRYVCCRHRSNINVPGFPEYSDYDFQFDVSCSEC